MFGVGCLDEDYPHKMAEGVLIKVKEQMDAEMRHDVINICMDYILNPNLDDIASIIVENCRCFMPVIMETVNMEKLETRASNSHRKGCSAGVKRC